MDHNDPRPWTREQAEHFDRLRFLERAGKRAGAHTMTRETMETMDHHVPNLAQHIAARDLDTMTALAAEWSELANKDWPGVNRPGFTPRRDKGAS